MSWLNWLVRKFAHEQLKDFCRGKEGLLRHGVSREERKKGETGGQGGEGGRKEWREIECTKNHLSPPQDPVPSRTADQWTSRACAVTLVWTVSLCGRGKRGGMGTTAAAVTAKERERTEGT